MSFLKIAPTIMRGLSLHTGPKEAAAQLQPLLRESRVARGDRGAQRSGSDAALGFPFVLMSSMREAAVAERCAG